MSRYFILGFTGAVSVFAAVLVSYSENATGVADDS